ncbi:LuxR family two component transcriptional regulator [Kribbella voronezhensis]|uniref:LuxR family two component transcriptional regulator n=1 Tax=Kribbella voronezhensis TaxID=2512212 RepID=A0A4R7THC3_9ACTN|nr:response regulator transcription factor [Kribbella voronezhensis]TDU91680.1 LuxR family two component transcriptional regulator [Kribbella voronezhensis]
MADRIRVVIVDGHTLTRFGLLGVVGGLADIEVVGDSGLGGDAVGLVEAVRPDVVVLDTALPDADGLLIARELRDRDDRLGIVLLAANGEDDLLFRALELGVSAFVTKTAPIAEVLAAIRHAAVAAKSFLASGLGPAFARRQLAAPVTVLSPRETEVLVLLGRGLTIPAIAGRIFVSASTAKTYVARIYEKLGASNRAQALMAGVRLGLISEELAAAG